MKAILKEGVITPIEPLPVDWEEGAALEIQRAETGAFDVDAWTKVMDELCADSSPKDVAAMTAAIQEHRLEAKEQMRRTMGLVP